MSPVNMSAQYFSEVDASGSVSANPSQKVASGSVSANPSQEVSSGSDQPQEGATGSDQLQEGATGSDPSQETSLGSDPSQEAASGSDQAQEATSGSDPSQETSLGSVPSQEAASGSDPSREAASGSVPSQEAAMQKLSGSRTVLHSQHRPDLCGSLIIKDKANIHYRAGVEAGSQLQFERAITCFYKAILLQPKQTPLYAERAEVYLQLCDFKSAALDYERACYLHPKAKAYSDRLAFIYYLQGQCLCDQGMFLEALESFAKASELKPDFKPYHMRSLACLSALGRYSDCIRLVTNWLKTGTPSADLFTLRARLYHQTSQVTLFYFDLKAALRLDPSGTDALSMLEKLEEAAEYSYQQAVFKAVEGELTDALSKITTALEQNPEKAQYYLFRGILFRRLKDFIAAIEDLVLAVELSDAGAACLEGGKHDDSRSLEEDVQAQLVLTYNDFAVQCFSQGLYKEATTLLTKAVQEQRDESGLFINRGDCFLKQEEWLFALADYQQAEELDPQNRNVWSRLAIIHNTLGLQSFSNLKFQEARERFSTAIKYNPESAWYFGNRAKAHIRLQNLEKAQQDAISAFILCPTDDELVPLLLKVFPGCSLSDVMSSATAQTVKAQLAERTQTWKLTSCSASRLSDKLERMTVQPETASQMSSSIKDVETRLKSCESPRDLLRHKKQVSQAVKKVLHQRPSLSHDGPRLSPLRPVKLPESAPWSAKGPYAWRNFGGLGLNC